MSAELRKHLTDYIARVVDSSPDARAMLDDTVEQNLSKYALQLLDLYTSSSPKKYSIILTKTTGNNYSHNPAPGILDLMGDLISISEDNWEDIKNDYLSEKRSFVFKAELTGKGRELAQKLAEEPTWKDYVKALKTKPVGETSS